MDECKNFKSFKQRGDWVELRFIATALYSFLFQSRFHSYQDYVGLGL